MSDVNFDCPLCGQNLDAPGDMQGMYIPCPACDEEICVPKPKPPPSETQMIASQGEATEEDKNSTVRIEVPPDFHMPAPKHRVVFIKRPDK